MVRSSAIEHSILLHVGIVAKGSKCLSILRSLRDIKPMHFRMNLVALAAVTPSAVCNKYASEMGVEVLDNPLDLLKWDNLDFILELTGDSKILMDLSAQKSSTTGILDRQASTFFFELALLYGRPDQQESENGQASSFASALLEASPDGVMVIDTELKIVKSNDAEIITGGKGGETLKGKYCHDIIQCTEEKCRQQNQSCPALQTFQTGKPSRKVIEIVDERGTVRISQVTAYPIFNKLNEIYQLVVTVRDITSDLSERIEAHTQAIKTDLARLVQEDRLSSLGRLVASVCHEINNPIASIVTFNKLILSHLKSNTMPVNGLAAFERYLDLSVKEALRCGSIVNNLLTFAREKSVKAMEIDLIELVHTITILTDHQMTLSGVEYRVHLPEAPFIAWGDKAQIQQCLMNLIFNAIEAMPDGGQLSIEGGREEDKNFVWITVTDSGPGIESKDLSMIFEPFYSTKSDGKGVGLGLSMVYGIIQEHHGSVDVSSNPGDGTTFKLRLPQKELI